MSGVIEKDEVLAIIADLKKEYPTHSVPDAEAKVVLRKVADKIRAIDAVSVVRCKDCKHWSGCKNTMRNNHRCSRAENVDYWTRADDFCSYGEREGE